MKEERTTHDTLDFLPSVFSIPLIGEGVCGLFVPLRWTDHKIKDQILSHFASTILDMG